MHKVTQRRLRPSLWLWRLVFVSVSLGLAAMAYAVGSIIVDGFQSLGAVSDSRAVFDLHWPLVGEYLGYDQSWGFHWPGWPLMRSLLVSVFPWSPTADLVFLALLWAGAAWILSDLAQRNWSVAWAGGLGFLALVTPGVVVTLQNYRPEVITALLLLIALRQWSTKDCGGRWILWLALLFLPLMHPLGVVVPGAWLGWGSLLQFRQQGFAGAWKRYGASAVAVGLGMVCFVLWFGFQPMAWEQFRTNLEAQRLLGQGLQTNHLTIFRWLYGGWSALPSALLMLFALVQGVRAFRSSWRRVSTSAQDHGTVVLCEPTIEELAGIGVLVAFGFNWLLKNPNPNHFMAVMPFVSWLFVSGVRQALGRWHRMLPIVACVLMVLASNALMAKYALALWRNEGRSYRASIAESLQALPAARKVWIPVAFWEAAQMSARNGKTQYQFSTFPNVLARSKREEYERQVLSDLQAGDLLIWDPLQEKGGVFNFVTETALRHRLIHPESQPESWERLTEIRIPVQYSRGQAVDFQVYRKK